MINLGVSGYSTIGGGTISSVDLGNNLGSLGSTSSFSNLTPVTSSLTSTGTTSASSAAGNLGSSAANSTLFGMDTAAVGAAGSALTGAANLYSAFSTHSANKAALKEQRKMNDLLAKQYEIENQRYNELNEERKKANATISAAASDYSVTTRD
ncbi:hypothetical protein FMM55_00655 [Campylobacter sp. LR196d]|uniref:hypothetical protein n=1 Tax=Campylobacter sp. LR196d TaxID=2593543 RepID=UPI00123863BC|nr:hypothetical protein [Campylobacter sp. LR196d]KAA6228831.1 hypothetical protein FMM55_00655 [Campylobacter sp. LR196d]